MVSSANPRLRLVTYLSSHSLVDVSGLQNLRTTYDASCLIGAAYVVLNPEYAKPSHRGARTGVFIALGLCAVVPVTQLVTRHGAMKAFSEMGLGWLLTSGTLYILGALV